MYKYEIIKLIILLAISLQCFGQKNINKDMLYPDSNISIEYHNDFTKAHYPTRISKFIKKPITYGGIVFLGNSITEEGNDWEVKFNKKGISNRGISGDITDGVLARLNEINFYKPKAVFLLIGLNDLWSLHENGVPSINYIENNIINIVNGIKNGSPKTKVFVQSILPTKNSQFISPINRINNFLSLNENNYNYQFIDLHSSFINSKGLIKSNLTYDDAHLTENGYKLWVENIKDIVNSL